MKKVACFGRVIFVFARTCSLKWMTWRKIQGRFEDADLAYRLKQRGMESRFIAEASVCHPWRTLRKGRKNWKEKGYEWESLMLFLQKHPTLKRNTETQGPISARIQNGDRDLFTCLFFLKGRVSMYLLINSCAHPLRQSEFVSGVGRNDDERTFHNCPLKFWLVSPISRTYLWSTYARLTLSSFKQLNF